ncbi:MAG: PHP domain-containing protein [Oscillospiraceae bacterium]|nr:PHP domain-containing protein [Oscillospiraceae bacterium]
MTADLHCHTQCSDGSVGINEIILLAARAEIPVISVTDHDTFSGSLQAVSLGKKSGVHVIPGAEFSTIDPLTGRKAHVLCYFCKHPEALDEFCTHMSQERNRAACQMLQKIMKIYPITREMVMNRAKNSTAVFKQHIMHALMDAGYADDFYGTVYHRLFHSQGGLAYVPMQYPDVHAVTAGIRKAGGVAVLAHPGEFDSYELLERLAASHEIDGVEVWHPQNRQGDEKRLSEIALRYGLIQTGGTDFHGMYRKKRVPIGTCTTPDEQLSKLIELGTGRLATS